MIIKFSKFLWAILFSFCVLGITSTNVYAAPSTYHIKDCSSSSNIDSLGLMGISGLSNDSNFELDNNINCTGLNFTPIIFSGPDGAFRGSLNGNGFTIQNIEYNTSSGENIGLFDSINGATISNLNIANTSDFTFSSSSSTPGFIGAVAGYANGYVSIDHVNVQINMSGKQTMIGGLIGDFYINHGEQGSLVISDSNVITQIDGTNGTYGMVGGLVGSITCGNESGDQCFNITRSHVYGIVGGTTFAGGFIGDYYDNGTLGGQITDSTFEGLGIGITGVDDSASTGGLIGYIQSQGSATGTLLISHCAVGAYIIIGNWDLGGIIGTMENYGNFKLSIDNVVVEAQMQPQKGYAGGIIGYYMNAYDQEFGGNPAQENLISESYTTGFIQGNDDDSVDYVGGIIGDYYNQAESAGNLAIRQVVSEMNIFDANSHIGGLAGSLNGGAFDISNSYAKGDIYGNGDTGGFIGFLNGFDEENTANVDKCYSSGTMWSSGIASGSFIGNTNGYATINNSFTVRKVYSNNTFYQGGFIGEVGMNDINLNNNYYDVSRVGIAHCIGQTDDGNIGGCTQTNTDNSEPDRFINNHTNTPLDLWSFEGITPIWSTVSDDFPVLVSETSLRSVTIPDPPTMDTASVDVTVTPTEVVDTSTPTPTPVNTSEPTATPTPKPTNTVTPTAHLHFQVATPTATLMITATPTIEITDNTLTTSVPTIIPTSHFSPTPVITTLPKTGNNTLIQLLGLTFILILGGGGVYWYSKRK